MTNAQDTRSRYWIDAHLQCSFVTDEQGKSIAVVLPQGWLKAEAIGFSRRTDGVVYVAAERIAALTATCERVPSRGPIYRVRLYDSDGDYTTPLAVRAGYNNAVEQCVDYTNRTGYRACVVEFSGPYHTSCVLFDTFAAGEREHIDADRSYASAIEGN